MKKYTSICCLIFWAVTSSPAQHIFRAPILSYLGQGLEDHKIQLFQLPYDGIGKRVLLEQYPQAWAQQSFTRYSLPTSAFVDAFGAISFHSPYTGYHQKPSRATLLSDQFGNIEGSFFSTYSPRYRSLDFVNQFDQQIRRKSDSNNNQLLDYAPGQRFTASNALSKNFDELVFSINSFYLNAKDWGGSSSIDPHQNQDASLIPGYIRDARHWQGSFGINYPEYQESYQLSFNAALTQHNQNLDWQRYRYQGRENQQIYIFTYAQKLKKADFKLRWQYLKDQSTETLDSLQLRLRDQYWRVSSEWRIDINRRLNAKGHLNVEQRPQQNLAWRPAAQLNWSFGLQRQYLLSAFGNSGQRLNKPLNFHLDRLRDGYTVRWEAKPYEVAHKIGLAFQYGGMLKLVLDRTWFQDKIITQLDRTKRQLVFRSFAPELRRDALEAVVNKTIDPSRKIQTQIMYRWEQWSPDLKTPWQAKHAAQFRLHWNHGLSHVSAHYLVRSPQNLVDLSSFPTPAQSSIYQRLDVTYSLRFKHRSSERPWNNRFSLSLQCINVLGKGAKNEQFETGLMLPGVEGPYWSDPQLRNVQISLRQEF